MKNEKFFLFGALGIMVSLILNVSAFSCVDSDNGINIYEQGFVKKDSVYKFDECYNGDKMVKEYYCSNGEIKSQYIWCSPGKCKSGKCISDTGLVVGKFIDVAAATNQCADSDGGPYPYTPGYVTITSSSGGTTFYYDECYSGTKVKEYYCKDADTKTYDYYTCPYGCQTTNQGIGYCASSTVTTTTTTSGQCYDSDGLNYYTYGYVKDQAGQYWYDYCEGNVIREQGCSGNVPYSVGYTCPYGCQNGACIAAPQQTTTTTSQQYIYYCSDSDGGDSPYVYGIVTGTTPHAPSWKAEFKDLCSGNVLVEYYCTSSSAYGNVPLGTKQYTCQYGCQNGACIAAPQQTTTTTPSQKKCSGTSCKVEQKTDTGYTLIWEDSDCGKSYYTYGELKYTVKETGQSAVSGKDICAQPPYQNYLVEFWLDPTCANGQALQTETIQCPSGYTCQNGACIAAPQQTTTTTTPAPGQTTTTTIQISKCTETDNALDEFTPGCVTYDKKVDCDHCISKNTLKEYYCNSKGKKDYDYVECQYGCENGACILPATTTTTPTCYDSDDKNPYTFGYVIYKGKYYYDECASGNKKVWEYYCDEKGKKNSDLTDCLYGCQNGACIAAPQQTTTTIPVTQCGNGICEAGEDSQNCPIDCPFVFTTITTTATASTTTTILQCYETDSGLDIYTKGTCSALGEPIRTDHCYFGKVWEYYCYSSKGKWECKHKTLPCPGDSKCVDGKCLTEEEMKCTETDNALDEFTPGCVTYQGKTYCDRCTSNNKKVLEYYCNLKGKKDYDYVECQYGCENGACILPATTTTTPTCYDSDGKNPNTLGYVIYNGKYYYDECASGNKKVWEYYCDEKGKKNSDLTDCLYGCQNGACIAAPQQTTTTIPVTPTQNCGDFKDCKSCIDNGCNWCKRAAPLDSWSYCTNDCNAFSCFLGKCISNSFEC